MKRIGASLADYRALILAPDRDHFLQAYRYDVSATTDDQPLSGLSVLASFERRSVALMPDTPARSAGSPTCPARIQ
jgi:hypothetical protein